MIPTILLVDTDSRDRDDWKALLQNQGFEVLTATNGKAAVEQCRSLQPDLVLLHDVLPDVSGCELCRDLKADPMNRLTPVVLVMPAADLAENSKAHQIAADDVWCVPKSRWEALGRVQALLQLKNAIDEQAKSVVFSLAQSIDAKDPKTAGHSGRSAEYALQLGESLRLNDEDLETLRIASLLHDIGKVCVPDAILSKPGPLTAEERLIVKQHPATGESICAPLKSLRHLLPLIRHHHERMDGSGYPDGLRGDRIPLKARILQIADVYDALTTARPYRDVLPPHDALMVLKKEAECGWLDSALVRKFCTICETAGPSLPRGRSMLASYYA
jgi:putative two-component system response regulator